jgi:hypothetical protein
MHGVVDVLLIAKGVTSMDLICGDGGVALVL